MLKPPLRSWLRDTRVLAGLSLGAVAAIGVTGTFAFWTDTATITGQTLTSGSIDLKAGADAASAADAFTTTTMGATAMVPGNTVAQTLVLKNAGTAPLKWTLAGGLGGTDAAAFGTASAMLLTITNGTASAGLCSGSVVASVSSVPLTSTTTTSIIGTRQALIPGNGGTTSLCLQIKLDDNAPQSLAGKTATPTFTFVGTSDVS